MKTTVLHPVSLIVVASFCTAALAVPSGSNIVATEKLSWRIANQLAAEAVGICEGRGYSVTATVVDTTGHQQT